MLGKSGRSRSNEELLAPDAVEEIRAVSDTLTYKQVRKYLGLYLNERGML